MTIVDGTVDSARYSVVEQIWDRQFGRWAVAPVIEAPKHIGGTEDAFVAYRRTSATVNNAEPFTHIELRDSVLIHFLRTCFPSQAGLYSKPAGIDAQLLYVSRNKVAAALAEKGGSNGLAKTARTLLQFVEGEFEDVQEKLAALPKGMIAWSLLWLLFETGQEISVTYEHTGEHMAMTLDGWAYGASSKGRTFEIQGHAFQWTGVRMQKISVTRKVMEYANLRSISSLPMQPLTAHDKKALNARAEIYLRYTKQAYCAYTGSFVIRSSTNPIRLNGDGRLMLDMRLYRRSVPILDVWDDDVNTTDEDLENVANDAEWSPETTAHLLPPILYGFSFVHKKWGEFSVGKLREIEWSSAPFNHLVLPPAYRNVVKSLIEIHSSDKRHQLVSDVVQGKSSGCIIALYGNPGCGKTLTAEAISEHLKRPLYSITAGELGSSVSTLESNLKNVLDLATYWRAVLLIDEADVFLEKRDSRELERNALISIFLRVLEYFSGILILTTNRLDSFDAAFLSRFSLILRYPDLDANSRRVLWERFLILAKGDVATFDIDSLATVPINGRNIKQIVRTAQALALNNEERLSSTHISTVMSMSTYMG